ncbi:hypothetical protein HQ865_01490 [Mucilaginibacter mali]|uniref:Uncharacterized protein n=1 Tax=Mucilaginibacter mali TaxID=2740462 RepID=A0A7D4PYX0_9SPHI|nr:hypothetical protein [Mucilaginibacter mali]QKJ28486.1 hypothetical protein HQ865_01490 [Mucilaginibacter mali]
MIAAFSIAAPAVVAQFYMTSATGKLTRLANIDQINHKPLTKYYRLSHYFISKRLAKTYSSHSVSSKGQRLTWYHYIACPIFADTIAYNVKLPGPGTGQLLDTGFIFTHYPADRKALIIVDGKPVDKAALTQVEVATVNKFYFTSAPQAMALYGPGARQGALVITLAKPVTIIPKAWLCYSDSKEVSNKLSQVEKDTLRKQFYNDSYLRFEKRYLNDFDYLDRMGYSAYRDNFVNAINDPASISDDPVIFEACYGSFANRSGYKLYWMLGLFALGALIFFLMLLSPPINRAEASGWLPRQF